MVCCLYLLNPVAAGESFLLLGGGPDPSSSQASIESNVQWIDDLLRRRNIDNRNIVFASGMSEVSDVKVQVPGDTEHQLWLPVARVFGQHNALFIEYRKNEVATDDRTTDADAIAQLLANRVAALEKGDTLNLIYNGHGGYHYADTDQNYLRLWGKSRLSVEQMSAMVENLDDDAAFRFVLPQCFSGSFINLMYRDIKYQSLDGIPGNRCGFVAVPDDLESEGCRPDLNVGDYRDYSNFFFASIDGRMRTGEPLSRDPDTDGDGEVSYREAHLFTYTEAYGRGIPRSTSDEFLMRWQPWYLRWLPDTEEFDNEYSNLLPLLATAVKIKYPAPRRALIDELGHRENEVRAAIDQINANIETQSYQVQSLQEQASERVLLRWPELSNPYSPQFSATIAADLGEISQWISHLVIYPKLKAAQTSYARLEIEQRSLQRDLGMILRLRRALRLASLRGWFERHADAGHKATYQKLKACESAVLPDR